MSKTAYYNGNIVTVNENDDIADSILIENGIITAVGSREKVFSRADGDTQKIDLQGKTMLPGFIDPHGHIVALAQTMLLLDFSSCTSKAEMLRKIADKLRDDPPKEEEWLIGFGYDNACFEDRAHPTKFDLDAVSSDIPIFISHASGHLAVANSAALEKLGYTGENYVVPAGGVVRTVSPDSREPSGILEENACLDPQKKRAIPAPPAEKLISALLEAQRIYAGYGITTAQDASVDPNIHQLLLTADHAGELKLDIVGHAVQKVTFDLLRDAGTPKREYVNHYKLLGGKTWLDGSPQGKTAWLTQPYCRPPEGRGNGYCGYGTQSDASVIDYFKGCIGRNLQVNVHANGDAAADQMIRCYRKAMEEIGSTADLRPVMVHAQTVREDQLDEMKALGIIPTFFLDHIWYWGDYHYESVLGPDRASRISPAASAVKRGMAFTLHQDPPVKMPNPILAIHNAVNRQTPKGRVLGVDQRISVMDAIRAVTIYGAYQYFEEEIKGSLEKGKYADLVILDQNPLQVHLSHLKDIQVLATVNRGKWFFKRGHLAKRDALGYDWYAYICGLWGRCDGGKTV